MSHGKVAKPKEVILYDGNASCVSESMILDEAFGVDVQAFLYTSKDVRKLIRFLNKAEKWMERKEQYKGYGVK